VLLILSGCKETSTEEVFKPQIDKYLAFWNTGNLAGVENVLCQDFQLREVPDFKPAEGIESFKKEMQQLHSMGFWLKLDEVIYADSTVTVRWTCGVTYPDNTGTPKIPVQGRGISLLHFRDGKIHDEWLAYDNKSWMGQLGYKMVK